MRGLLDILFPPSCVGCGQVLAAEAFFCEPCDAKIERLPRESCPRCAEPGDFSSEGGVCPRCLERPPPFTSAWAPFAHEGPVARAIHRYKYEDHPELAAPLGTMLATEARPYLSPFDEVICALPLHPSRMRERRYDQAELLAGELARALGRTRLQLLDRVRATKRQVGLHEGQREHNVAGAFEARPDARGRRVLLVDDVFTTGATARAAATALLEGGALSVRMITLARAFSV